MKKLRDTGLADALEFHPPSLLTTPRLKFLNKVYVYYLQIGKYSHVGSHPFIYIQGAAARASPTKSSKLIELLTTKSPVTKEDVNKENKEVNQQPVKREEISNGQNGDNRQQVEDESTSDPIR